MDRPDYFVTAAEALDGYRLRLTFEDRTEGTVDLSDLVLRKGVFQPLKDREFFRLARADAEAGTVVWPNEVDVAPEELYARAHPQGRSRDSVLTATGMNDRVRRRTMATTRVSNRIRGERLRTTANVRGRKRSGL